MAFENLDLKRAKCFGFQKDFENNWQYIAKSTLDTGWKNAPDGTIEMLERSLKNNVDASYIDLCSFVLKDLDDDTLWQCKFNNDKMLWTLSIFESPNAEVELDQKQAFFSSEAFKKIANTVDSYVTNGVDAYNEFIKEHLENGELIAVDPVKLERILFSINVHGFMDNLRSGAFMK